MRVVLQRVRESSVSILGEMKAQIGEGFLILLGICEDDGTSDIDWIVRKILALRIFEDREGKMNLSIMDIHGEILVISQFTLYASTKKGNRPSFVKAAKPSMAEELYEDFLRKISEKMGLPCQSGEFGANMQVSLVNNGPATIMMDSKLRE